MNDMAELLKATGLIRGRNIDEDIFLLAFNGGFDSPYISKILGVRPEYAQEIVSNAIALYTH